MGGVDKPYLCRGKAYKRHDSAVVEVGRLEYNRLVLEGFNRNFEDLPAASQDLTLRVLEDKMFGVLNIGADERRVLDALSDNRVLTRVEIEEATGYNTAKLLRVIPRLLEKTSSQRWRREGARSIPAFRSAANPKAVRPREP